MHKFTLDGLRMLRVIPVTGDVRVFPTSPRRSTDFAHAAEEICGSTVTDAEAPHAARLPGIARVMAFYKGGSADAVDVTQDVKRVGWEWWWMIDRDTAPYSIPSSHTARHRRAVAQAAVSDDEDEGSAANLDLDAAMDADRAAMGLPVLVSLVQS